MQKKKQKRKFSKFKPKQRFWPRLIWCLITDLKEKIMRNYCEKRWRGKHAATASKVVDNSTSDNQALPYLKNPQFDTWVYVLSSSSRARFRVYCFWSHFKQWKGSARTFFRFVSFSFLFPYHFQVILVFQDIEILNIHKYPSWNI